MQLYKLKPQFKTAPVACTTDLSLSTSYLRSLYNPLPKSVWVEDTENWTSSPVPLLLLYTGTKPSTPPERRHLRESWTCVFVFVCLGAAYTTSLTLQNSLTPSQSCTISAQIISNSSRGIFTQAMCRAKTSLTANTPGVFNYTLNTSTSIQGS